MSKNNIGFMASLGFGQMEPEEVLRILSGIGYKGVEWTLAHVDPRKKSIEEIKEIVKLTKQYGLEVSEIVVQQDLITLDENLRRERMDFTLQCIEKFSSAGVKIINLFTGPAPWDLKSPKIGQDITEGKAWDIVYKFFDEIIPLAEKCKMNLAVEGVWGMLCHDYYTTRLLIDKFDSPYLGLNFDPSHDVLSGNLDVGWIIKQWGNKIKHIHLKDAAGIPEQGKFIFPLLGEGNVNWQDFFKALEEISYQGYMSVEFESFTYYHQVLKDSPEEAAKISMEQIKKISCL